jgi:hypothetical protein
MHVEVGYPTYGQDRLQFGDYRKAYFAQLSESKVTAHILDAVTVKYMYLVKQACGQLRNEVFCLLLVLKQ